jgi:hypothetical protein
MPQLVAVALLLKPTAQTASFGQKRQQVGASVKVSGSEYLAGITRYGKRGYVKSAPEY